MFVMKMKPLPWEIPNKHLLTIKRGGVTITLVEKPKEVGGGQFATANFEPGSEWPFPDLEVFYDRYMVREQCEARGGYLFAGWASGSGIQFYPSWGQPMRVKY